MLMQLQKELGLSLLFISHDIGVIRFISDRIGVMYLGTLVEETDTEELFANPLHPYTKGLFASVPDPYIERDGFQSFPENSRSEPKILRVVRSPHAVRMRQKNADRKHRFSEK